MSKIYQQEKASSTASPKLAYSIEELLAAVPVGRTSLYGEIKAGRLNTIKIGRRTLIAVEEARRWLRDHAAK